MSPSQYSPYPPRQRKLPARGDGRIDPLGTLLSVGQFSVSADRHPLLFINLGFLYFVGNCATLLLELFIYCFTPHKEALWIPIFPLHLMAL